MKRRKFLTGVGALAAGTTAAVGTGAFTSASAERTIDVQVSSDPNAYIGLEATDETYTRYENGSLVLDFNGDNGQGGMGLNSNSVTEYEHLFKIMNRGDSEVYVGVLDDFAESSPVDIPSMWTDETEATVDNHSYWGPARDSQGLNRPDIFEDPDGWPPEIVGSTKENEAQGPVVPLLEPGEAIYVNLQFNTEETSPGAIEGGLSVLAVERNGPRDNNPSSPPS